MIITNNSDCAMCISEEESFVFQENYAYIYVVQLNRQIGDVINSSKIRLAETDKITFKFDEDGFYTIARVTIPTIPNDSYLYYYDGENFRGRVTGEVVSLQTVVDDASAGDIEYTGFFSTCRLRKCFVSLCKRILNEGPFSGDKCKIRVDSTLIYQRDLVWSVYNVIQYMLDFGQYLEAQRLIERINVCPGICHGVEPKNGGGCGCHGN